MKKLLAPVLMITLTLLCACSAKGGAEDKAIEIGSKYLEGGELSLRAEMTAGYGGRVRVVLEIYTVGDGSRMTRTWFYEDTLEPAAAELYSDGVSLLRCAFE